MSADRKSRRRTRKAKPTSPVIFVGGTVAALVLVAVLVAISGRRSQGVREGGARSPVAAMEPGRPRRLDDVVDPAGPRRLDDVVDPTGPRPRTDMIDTAGAPAGKSATEVKESTEDGAGRLKRLSSVRSVARSPLPDAPRDDFPAVLDELVRAAEGKPDAGDAAPAGPLASGSAARLSSPKSGARLKAGPRRYWTRSASRSTTCARGPSPTSSARPWRRASSRRTPTWRLSP